MGSRIDLGIESPCTSVRLASKEAISSIEHDLGNLVRRLIERQPSLEPETRPILSALSSGMNDSRLNLLTSILDLAS